MSHTIEDKQKGQSRGLSIRVGPGLNERIQEIVDGTGQKKSDLLRWLIEAGMDTLDDARKNPKTKLHSRLEFIHKSYEPTIRNLASRSTATTSARIDDLVGQKEFQVTVEGLKEDIAEFKKMLASRIAAEDGVGLATEDGAAITTEGDSNPR